MTSPREGTPKGEKCPQPHGFGDSCALCEEKKGEKMTAIQMAELLVGENGLLWDKTVAEGVQLVTDFIKAAEDAARAEGFSAGKEFSQSFFYMRICGCGDKESAHADRKGKCDRCACLEFILPIPSEGGSKEKELYMVEHHHGPTGCDCMKPSECNCDCHRPKTPPEGKRK